LNVGWVIALELAVVESRIMTGLVMVSMKNSTVCATVRLIKTISRMLVAVATFLLWSLNNCSTLSKWRYLQAS
jgi:hypothetical protein